MRLQYENLLLGNFLLFLDHHLGNEGEAYTNHSSNFYPIADTYEGYQVYASPFKQFVCDESITGSVNPNILSGVRVDGQYIQPSGFAPRGGALEPNGFININPYNGQVNFASGISQTVSGDYAVKDFNIYLTNDSEQDLLFETVLFEKGLKRDDILTRANEIFIDEWGKDKVIF